MKIYRIATSAQSILTQIIEDKKDPFQNNSEIMELISAISCYIIIRTKKGPLEKKKIFVINLNEDKNNLTIADDPLPDDIISQLKESIDSAGEFKPTQCQIFPSVATQSNLNLNLPYSAIFNFSYKKSEADLYMADKEFDNFFQKWLDNRIVVPDTCILQSHYLTKIILPRLSIKPKIMIPRTVLLELEAIGNDTDPLKKRIAQSAFNEIRKLQLEYKARTFRKSLDNKFLNEFSEIRGNKNADRFIRNEIWVNSFADVMQGRSEEMVLVTRDLINAFTASAEDIDTFYFSRYHDDIERSIHNDIDFKSILLECAISFESIYLDGLFKNYLLQVKGMWSGKTAEDWYQNRVEFSLIDKNLFQ